MELQEVTRRVLLGHWVVILGFVIASAGAVAALHIFDKPIYSASTRVVLDAPAPTSGTEATAVADAAKAIVTSPTHIIAALNAAGVVRDPVKLTPNIALAPLGTSGVLQLTVQDSDPAAAASIANALADDLIQTRLAVSPVARKAALDTQIKGVNDNISAIDAQIKSLNEQLSSIQVDPSNPQTAAVKAQILSDRITAYSSQRAALTEELIHLDSQRAGLGSASDTTPSVIDKAIVPTKPDPPRVLIDLALALVIGSVLGVAAAAILETFRPTLASGDAVAKALGVAVLGWLPDTPGTLPLRIKLAANAADVRALELIGVGDIPDLSALAKSLRGPLSKGQGEGKGLSIASIEDAPVRNRNGQAPASGFVLVAPQRIRKAALAPVLELLSISGRPLVGVIAHKPGRAVKTPMPAVKPAPRFAVVLNGEKEPLAGMSKEMQSDLWGAQ
jgi:capsular polysaccharide biosynthesis protein